MFKFFGFKEKLKVTDQLFLMYGNFLEIKNIQPRQTVDQMSKENNEIFFTFFFDNFCNSTITLLQYSFAAEGRVPLLESTTKLHRWKYN